MLAWSVPAFANQWEMDDVHLENGDTTDNQQTDLEVPDETVPDETVPDETVPGETVPGDLELPDDAFPVLPPPETMAPVLDGDELEFPDLGVDELESMGVLPSSTPSDAVPGNVVIMPMAVYPNVDDGSMSTSIVQYFKDIVVKLPYGTKYVLFRESDYSYRLVYGKDLDVSGTRFTGTGLDYVRYYRTSSNSVYYFATGHEGDFSLSTGGMLVYSNVGGMYPVLIGGVYTYEIQTVLFVLVLTLLLAVCKSFFSTGRYRI